MAVFGYSGKTTSDHATEETSLVPHSTSNPPSLFFSPLFFFLLYDRPVRSFRENSSPRASPTTYTRFPPGRRLNGRTCYHLASFRRAPREFLPFDVPSQAGGDRISARRARFPFRQTGNPLLRPGSGGCPLLTSMNTGIVIVRKVKFSLFPSICDRLLDV